MGVSEVTRPGCSLNSASAFVSTVSNAAPFFSEPQICQIQQEFHPAYRSAKLLVERLSAFCGQLAIPPLGLHSLWYWCIIMRIWTHIDLGF